jgi:hypothetical protein
MENKGIGQILKRHNKLVEQYRKKQEETTD